MKSTLQQLEELCMLHDWIEELYMLHDWTDEQSDDHSVWREGSAKAIVDMQDKCMQDGYSHSEIIKVMSKYYFELGY